MHRIFVNCKQASTSLYAAPSLLEGTSILSFQARGRRRTLTPHPWNAPVYAPGPAIYDEAYAQVLQLEREAQAKIDEAKALENPVDQPTAVQTGQVKRVGLVATKLGMIPQWTNTGDRMLCTLLHVQDNHVISLTSPEDWYRQSIVGKRKAFGRFGPMWKVTVGAIDTDANEYHRIYRRLFQDAGVPVKKELASFLVSPDALPALGQRLDVRHFNVGQYITATGKTIDWGFQGAMHRWGFRGQPEKGTTKSHRRVGSIGSVGDARVWPGKRLPGHMGYEWRMVPGIQIVRMNLDKQVIYVKGNVPGDVGEKLLLKDCLQAERHPKELFVPTWNSTITPTTEEGEPINNPVFKYNEAFIPTLFRFDSPSIVFTEEHGKKGSARDKTKAKIAKVKK